jgi:P-type E1-E2 ATPase
MLAAAGNLARHGVLVRNLQALESLAEIDTVIFDKTGTLTQDGQRITQVMTAPGVSPDYALGLAAALAKHSLHPLSRALVKAHEASGLGDAPVAEDVNEMIGLGLEGHLDGVLRLGSAKFCAPKTKGIPAKTQVCQVHLCTENEWLASWQLSEDVRADAVQTVQALTLDGAEGARVHVTDLSVTVDKVETTAEGFIAEGEWTALGTVGHWGHQHQRVNRYKAKLTVQPIESEWKITALEVLEERRL